MLCETTQCTTYIYIYMQLFTNIYISLLATLQNISLDEVTEGSTGMA